MVLMNRNMLQHIVVSDGTLPLYFSSSKQSGWICLIAYYLMTYTGGRNKLPDNERSTTSVCMTVNIDTH
jgi:hypothetical protein